MPLFLQLFKFLTTISHSNRWWGNKLILSCSDVYSVYRKKIFNLFTKEIKTIREEGCALVKNIITIMIFLVFEKVLYFSGREGDNLKWKFSDFSKYFKNFLKIIRNLLKTNNPDINNPWHIRCFLNFTYFKNLSRNNRVIMDFSRNMQKAIQQYEVIFWLKLNH